MPRSTHEFQTALWLHYSCLMKKMGVGSGNIFERKTFDIQDENGFILSL